MITQVVKKIWYGDTTTGTAKITLRDYVVKKALKYQEKILVIYKTNSMVLTPKQLEKPLGERTFKSKIGKEDYKLLDYYWQPEDKNIDLSDEQKAELRRMYDMEKI